MTHTLKIRRIAVDGTVTDIQDMGSTLLEYEPLSENMQVVLDNPDATLVESAQFLLTAANVQTLETAIRNIQAAFVSARSREKTRAGDRIFVVFSPDGYNQPYRSPVVDGKVAIGPEGLDWQWVGLKVECLVTWTRRAWWERDTMVEIGLANSSTGGNPGVGGVQIYNHDDSTVNHDNYVQVAAADVAGVLPSPVQLRLYNNFNGDMLTGNIYAYQAILNNAANFPHILEGENGMKGSGITGSVQSGDNTMSNGGDYQLTFSGTGEQQLISWTLTSALLNAARGRFYQLMARIVPITGAINQIKLRVTLAIYGAFYQGAMIRQMSNSENMFLLGTIQIPPGSFVYSTGLLAMGLYITVQCDDAASRTIKFDYLQLSPVDGWRLYKPNTLLGLVFGKELVDDGVEYQTVYQTLYPNDYSEGNFFKTSGKLFMVYPGMVQRFYFSQNMSDISRTLVIRLYHRPRVLTV